jgi:hypothetical protein
MTVGSGVLQHSTLFHKEVTNSVKHVGQFTFRDLEVTFKYDHNNIPNFDMQSLENV